MRKWSNNGVSLLSASMAPGDTTLLINALHGSRFPAIAAPDTMDLTLQDAAGNIEVMSVTAHTAGSGTFTVARAQQGTTARSWASGDLVECRPTEGAFSSWEQDIDDLQASRALKGGETYAGTHDFSAATLLKLCAALLAADLDAGAKKIVNLANAVNAGDAVNLATAQALLSGGGTPASIPVTSLGVGSAVAGQMVRVNDAGTGIVGDDLPIGAILYLADKYSAI